LDILSGFTISVHCVEMGVSFTEFGLIKWSGIRLRTAVALLWPRRDSLIA